MIIKLYLLGVAFAIGHFSYLVYKGTEYRVNYLICLITTLKQRNSWRYTLQSWVYFLNG